MMDLNRFMLLSLQQTETSLGHVSIVIIGIKRYIHAKHVTMHIQKIIAILLKEERRVNVTFDEKIWLYDEIS